MKRTMPALLVFLAFWLAACSAQPTPAPTTPSAHLCTVTVASGEGWDSVLGKFDAYGKTPKVLINGVSQTAKQASLDPGDVVSLVGGTNCTGEYNQAQWMGFDDGLVSKMNGDSTVLSGFQRKIEPTGTIEANVLYNGVQETLHELCSSVARTYGNYQIADIFSGCNFVTVARASYASGQTTCSVYNTVPEANKALAALANLSDVQSLGLAVLTAPDKPQDLCRK